MITINYVITDELGIHARPAGKLVKAASAFPCTISIGTPQKMVDAKRIMGMMGLALKKDDELTMAFDGEREREASETLAEFLRANL